MDSSSAPPGVYSAAPSSTLRDVNPTIFYSDDEIECNLLISLFFVDFGCGLKWLGLELDTQVCMSDLLTLICSHAVGYHYFTGLGKSTLTQHMSLF